MSVYSGFDQVTLNREYSPSHCVDDINVFLEAYARESRNAVAAAASHGRCARDLGYGVAADEWLDLFLPTAPAGAPLHVFIHGGYWQALHKDDSLFAATMFQQHGACFAAINYSLAPTATLSQIVEQNRRAICWLHQNAVDWGFDHDRIYLSGSSAGAHLVMMMLLTDWSRYGLPTNAIKGVCAVSGIYDLEPVRLSYVNDVVGMDRREAAQNSPMGKLLKNHCPIILAYGDNETSEFKRQSNDYRDFLAASGEQVSFNEISNRNHFDIIMDLMQAESWLAREVLRQMGLS